ncbi:MAG: helix-turn-helix domain-containing protein [Alphaproteobacteria bacterium]|nr:helix-turn-helix domain-containing protein [Alphaproteobacteria bacterium]
MRNDLLGIGLYTVSEASRLCGVRAQSIRRWIGGYRYRNRGEIIFAEPLWTPQVKRHEERLILGFRDLAELRVVDALLKQGLSLHAIRRAISRAREALDDERPFSTRQFRTDGRSIFLDLAKQDDEPALLDLLRNQYGIKRAIEPSLRDFEYDEKAASRWWPLSSKRSVVIDPKRAFGAPIEAESGVPVDVIVDAVDAEGSVRRAARAFGVAEASVRDALKFNDAFGSAALAA